VKVLYKAILPALIASAVTGSAWAQDTGATAGSAKAKECVELEGAPPGLYTTTEEGKTLLIKDGEVVELSAGEAGFADESGVTCITKPPKFLDWPCSTQAAQSRMFNTYTIEELKTGNKLKEIVERYFTVPEVLIPIPNWIDGEFNATFNYTDLFQFSSPEYWYHPDPSQPVLSGKRPHALLVSLYVGINQVVLDNYMIDALRKDLGSDELPVAFVFNDSNTVPVSYFGSNVSIEEISEAFNIRGIKLAEVPMWWQGDYHLLATIEEYEKFFDIPALEDISAEKQAAIKAELEAYGFRRKSIIVTMFAESGAMAVDQPERVRVAASTGIVKIPTTVNFVEEDYLVARCGPGTPTNSGPISGSTTPIGGPTIPPGVDPPPPEVIPPEPPPASDS